MSPKACRPESLAGELMTWARRRRMISPSTSGYSSATFASLSCSSARPPGWIASATSRPPLMLVSSTRSKPSVEAASAGLWLRSSLGGPSSPSRTRIPPTSKARTTSSAMADLEQVGDEHVLVAHVHRVAVAELLDVSQVLAVGAELLG